MGQKQQAMSYDGKQETRRGGLAHLGRNLKTPTHVKVGNCVHEQDAPKGEVTVGNSPHPSYGRK